MPVYTDFLVFVLVYLYYIALQGVCIYILAGNLERELLCIDSLASQFLCIDSLVLLLICIDSLTHLLPRMDFLAHKSVFDTPRFTSSSLGYLWPPERLCSLFLHNGYPAHGTIFMDILAVQLITMDSRVI